MDAMETMERDEGGRALAGGEVAGEADEGDGGGGAGGAEDLVMSSSLPMLCSRPLQASMKNNLGFPTSEGTSHISVTRDSMFQVLLPSLSWRKLSAVPWLMTRRRKVEASAWSEGRVSFLLTLFIHWLVRSRWISTLKPISSRT